MDIVGEFLQQRLRVFDHLRPFPGDSDADLSFDRERHPSNCLSADRCNCGPQLTHLFFPSVQTSWPRCAIAGQQNCWHGSFDALAVPGSLCVSIDLGNLSSWFQTSYNDFLAAEKINFFYQRFGQPLSSSWACMTPSRSPTTVIYKLAVRAGDTAL